MREQSCVVRVVESQIFAVVLRLAVVDPCRVEGDQYRKVRQILCLREIVECQLSAKLPVRRTRDGCEKLRHPGIRTAVVSFIVGTGRGIEVTRIGVASDVDVVRTVDGDAGRFVAIRAADMCCVFECGAGRIKLCDEGIVDAVISALIGIACHGNRAVGGFTHHPGTAD